MRGRLRTVALTICSALLCIVSVCLSSWPQQLTRANQSTTRVDGYVGSSACAGCHDDLYATYSETAMGRSMRLANDSSILAKASTPFTVFSPKTHRSGSWQSGARTVSTFWAFGIHFLPERSSVHSQEIRGFHLIAAGDPQSFSNKGRFHVAHDCMKD